MSEKNARKVGREQIKLQTLHNRFIRGAIVSVCRIALWTMMLVGIISIIKSGATGIIAAMSSSAATSSVSSYLSDKSSSDSGFNSGIIIGVALVLAGICVIVYFVKVIGLLGKTIADHKAISEMENAYLGISQDELDGEMSAAIPDDETVVADPDDEDGADDDVDEEDV